MTGDVLEVVVVEDDFGLRSGLKLLLDGSPGFRCRGAFGSAEDALRGLGTRAPDAMLLDIQLPGVRGSEAVASFVERYPTSTVVMLTMYADDETVFEALCNGASGYLLKKTPPERLLEAVREAVDGGSPMSPEIARRVVALFRRLPPPSPPDHDLTPQELRVLSLLAEGSSYQAVADRLGITINTVRKYVRAVYDKLHVHSKSEAVAKALRTGLL